MRINKYNKSKNVQENSSSGSTLISSGVMDEAQRLVETHNIYGQPFNGTQDVDGDLTTSGTIQAKGDITTESNVIGNKFIGDVEAEKIDTTLINAQMGNILKLYGNSLNYDSAEIRDAIIKTLQSDYIVTENLTVTKQAHFFELIIDKIKSAGGAVILSPAEGFCIDQIKTWGMSQNLPDDYLELDYIENPSNAYIVTDIICKKSPRVVMSAQIGNDDKDLFGFTTNNSLYFAFNCAGGKDAYLRYGNNTYRNLGNILNDRFHLIDFGQSYYIDNVWQATFEDYDFSKNTEPMKIFNGRGSLFMPSKISWVKIYDGEELVGDFIPCMNEENIVGMFDCISQKFYKSENATNFIPYHYPLGAYRCYWKVSDGNKTLENMWKVGDQAICQTFDVKEGVNHNARNKYYWALVEGVGQEVRDDSTYNYIDLSTSIYDGMLFPEIGDARRLGVRVSASV